MVITPHPSFLQRSMHSISAETGVSLTLCFGGFWVHCITFKSVLLILSYMSNVCVHVCAVHLHIWSVILPNIHSLQFVSPHTVCVSSGLELCVAVGSSSLLQVWKSMTFCTSLKPWKLDEWSLPLPTDYWWFYVTGADAHLRLHRSAPPWSEARPAA